MSGENEAGKCQICGKDGIIERAYFRYNIKCECHSPQHFEIVWHCEGCVPKEPVETKLSIKTEHLKSMANHPTIPEATKVITDALEEDKSEGSYYYSWQANIAMAYIDNERWYKEKTGKETLTEEDKHTIANNAAKYFLNLLCMKPDNSEPTQPENSITIV